MYLSKFSAKFKTLVTQVCKTEDGMHKIIHRTFKLFPKCHTGFSCIESRFALSLDLSSVYCVCNERGVYIKVKELLDP